MAQERRNDIGWKIAMATVAIIITIFFNNVYSMSKDAKAEACTNTVINATQAAQISSVMESVVRIDKNTEKILDKIDKIRE